jgi:pyruvate formate lyase activating enzyme
MKRRDFLKLLVCSSLAMKAEAREIMNKGVLLNREALHYQKKVGNAVGCRLCPRNCDIPDGATGFCRARRNSAGTLYSLGYASPCAIHIDPIEKKPFFNYLPKTKSFSIASAGCNLRCKFCQNWDISQASPADTMNYSIPPAELVKAAQDNGCRSIAYTYTEPSTYFEYMLDTARIARSSGVLNVYHSNGYINQEPLRELCTVLDAANVDLKGFTPEYYRSMCEAELAPVLETLKTLKKSGVWLELTNLVIPGHNDDPATIRRMADWIRQNLGAETPLHFSRFFPLYKLTHISPTPLPALEKARDAALKAGLKYVYIGNLPGHAGNNTFCPKCSKLVIKRTGFSVSEMHLKGSACVYCGYKLHGRWA